jgi:hypothetical protein
LKVSQRVGENDFGELSVANVIRKLKHGFGKTQKFSLSVSLELTNLKSVDKKRAIFMGTIPFC